MTVSVEAVNSGQTGYWSVKMTNRNHLGQVQTVDVTFFRGIPAQIGSVTFTEPYGPAEATVSFPTVSALEPFGNSSSDLWWLRDGSRVEITWIPTDPDYREVLGMPSVLRGALDPTGGVCRWEGRLVSVDASNSGTGVTVQCIGALRVLDNYLAQPMVAARPTPVEHAIRRAFAVADARHPTGLRPLDIRLNLAASQHFDPSIYQKGPNGSRKKKAWYLKPRGLGQNELWSGLITRNLGGWNKTLSEYVDPLLKIMRTHFGVYTIRLYPGLQPVLMHRSTIPNMYGELVAIVNLIAPGVELSVSYDYSQTLTTVYGKSEAVLSGTSYDGAVYDPDGTKYWFKPFATSPWVDPDNIGDKRDEWAMRREVYDEFPQGMQVEEALSVARRHLSMTGDTGVNGQLTLRSTDPQIQVGSNISGRYELMPFPRQMIMPGMALRLDGLHGAIPGPLVMATEVTQSPEDDSVSITYDSKFRDYTTVREVRLRNRDALKPTHSLVVPGDYKMNVEDPLIPWSYAKGCGYFPRRSRQLWSAYTSFPEANELEFHEALDGGGWLHMTRRFPPKNWSAMYSKIPKSPTGHRGTLKKLMNPAVFWNAPAKPGESKKDKRVNNVLLSQQGTINRIEIMAVDADGELLRVPFHVSVWRTDVGANSTPRLPTSPDDDPKGVVQEFEYRENGKTKKKIAYKGANGRWYEPGKPYPFFRSAWDRVDSSGRILQGRTNLSQMFVGWGNSYEKAGYWPGSDRLGDAPTGLFVDSTPWQYNQQFGQFRTDDEYDKESDEIAVATAHVMIFCDHLPNQDVYFIGRMYKQEQEGTS